MGHACLPFCFSFLCNFGNLEVFLVGEGKDKITGRGKGSWLKEGRDVSCIVNQVHGQVHNWIHRFTAKFMAKFMAMF